MLAAVVHDGFETLGDDKSMSDHSGTISDLLSGGESQRVEFKATAQWNVKADCEDKRMGHAVVRTVCGFLNAEGGTLFVGVGDGGKPLGLNADLGTLTKKPNLDGYELFLREGTRPRSLSATTCWA